MSFTSIEMQNQVWEALGRPTNLNPTTAAGAATLNSWLNEGQRQVASWKDPVTGRRIRFNCLYSTLNFNSVVIEDVLEGVNNTTFPYSIGMTATRGGDSSDRYNNWVVEM